LEANELPTALAEISFDAVLLQLFGIAQRFRMEAEPRLVVLQKMVLNAEGRGRQLSAKLGPVEDSQPLLRPRAASGRGHGRLREKRRVGTCRN
jgi:ubiquinone biosynthesis protein